MTDIQTPAPRGQGDQHSVFFITPGSVYKGKVLSTTEEKYSDQILLEML